MYDIRYVYSRTRVVTYFLYIFTHIYSNIQKLHLISYTQHICEVKKALYEEIKRYIRLIYFNQMC